MGISIRDNDYVIGFRKRTVDASPEYLDIKKDIMSGEVKYYQGGPVIPYIKELYEELGYITKQEADELIRLYKSKYPGRA